MKRFLQIIVLAIILSVTGCYSIEDAADVNQQRIETTYCTVFNATRGSTKTYVAFKFGNTPLRVDNPIYFDQFRLYEDGNGISGLYYARDLDGYGRGFMNGWMNTASFTITW